MVMLILLLCVSCITVNAKDGLPKSIITEENPFRTAKMNFIWLKATHHLTDKSVLKLVKVIVLLVILLFFFLLGIV